MKLKSPRYGTDIYRWLQMDIDGQVIVVIQFRTEKSALQRNEMKLKCPRYGTDIYRWLQMDTDGQVIVVIQFRT